MITMSRAIAAMAIQRPVFDLVRWLPETILTTSDAPVTHDHLDHARPADEADRPTLSFDRRSTERVVRTLDLCPLFLLVGCFAGAPTPRY